MDQEKRKIIVGEIEHWRRSKLLPGQYCDFLLNLYMDEAQQAKEKDKSRSILGVSSGAVKNSNWKTWLTIFGIIGLISFLGLHFTSFSFGMQTAISVAFLSVLYMIGGVQRTKQPVLSYMCFGAASVLLLLAGIYLLHLKDITGMALVFYAGLCGLVWIVTGILARAPVFHLAGWLVLFLIYALVLRHNIRDIDLIGLELSWVPVSLVLLWLGWLFHHMNKQIAAVLLLAGALCWFGAEVYGFGLTELASTTLQLFLYLKLAVICGLLFGLRKKWIEWVM